MQLQDSKLLTDSRHDGVYWLRIPVEDVRYMKREVRSSDEHAVSKGERLNVELRDVT